MATRQHDRTLERYAIEYGTDPEFLAEGLAIHITDQLVEVLRERSISRSELARKMGVSRAHVSKILSAPPNLTLLSLCKMAAALGLNPAVTLDMTQFPVKVKRRTMA